MKRDVVAPVRKAKVPISAAPMNRDLRPRGRDFRYATTSSGEFKFKSYAMLVKNGLIWS